MAGMQRVAFRYARHECGVSVPVSLSALLQVSTGTTLPFLHCQDLQPECSNNRATNPTPPICLHSCRYAAVLEMLEGGAILKLDQEYLETVIPVRIFLEREGSQVRRDRAVQRVDVELMKFEETGGMFVKQCSCLLFCTQPIGGRLAVVLGEWRGHEGSLEGLDMDSYSVRVTVDKGPLFKQSKHRSCRGQSM